MKERFGIKEFFKRMFVAKRKADDQLNLGGTYKVEHWRDGKLLRTIEGHNLVTNVGKNYALGVAFVSTTQIGTSSWVIGLISDDSYTGIVVGDTMSSHAGWTEFTGYSEANRVAWGQGAVASQVTTNASPAVFSITSADTIKGFFVTSQNTKGGTTGTLWSGVLFTSGDTPVINGDELRVTYSLGA